MMKKMLCVTNLIFSVYLFGCAENVSRKFTSTMDEIEFDQNRVISSPKPGEFKLYVSTQGNDQNSGRSNQMPVLTLYRIHKILQDTKPDSDIRIYIDTGVYFGQQLNWTFVNGHHITITGPGKNSKKPIFDGLGKETWFRLDVKSGVSTNIHFQYLEIMNYNLGIGLTGDRDNPKTGWNGKNSFYDLYFHQIGSKYSTKQNAGYSAINLINSRKNKIVNCRFSDVENLNKNGDDKLIHAIYFAHYSSNNIVKNCHFVNNSGDPIRIRDESNNNVIKQNEFLNTGSHAFYSEWYCCSETTSKSCTKSSGECSSFGNIFSGNICDKGYKGREIDLVNLIGNEEFCGKIKVRRLIYKRNKRITTTL